MVPRPPARHFQPVEMNTTSMDLLRVSVKRGGSWETTANTKKIHNGETKRTKTNEGRVAAGATEQSSPFVPVNPVPSLLIFSLSFVISPPPLRPHSRHGERMLPPRALERGRALVADP